MTSTKIGLLNLPQLPMKAREAHVFPGLTEMSLVSTLQLCDAGLYVEYSKDDVVVKDKKGKELLRGERDSSTQMWMMPLTDESSKLQCANIIHHQNDAERVEFVSRMLGNPAYSTLLRAAQNPGQLPFPAELLTAEMVRRNPPDARRAALGHLDLNRQGQRSTQRQAVQDITDEETDEDDVKYTDEPIKKSSETNDMYTAVWTTPSFAASMDATGLAPTKWITKGGAKYMLILYNYDANYIMLLELANDTASALRDAYKVAHEKLKKVGMAPKIVSMDNKMPALVKKYFEEVGTGWQLATPDTHRTLSAERGVRTAKNHVVGTMSGIGDCPPSIAWTYGLREGQFEYTLNFLRLSRLNPRFSAYQQLHGAYDFNRAPMAPLGTSLIIYNKPNTANRLTWSEHGEDGFYVGPALDHYRSYTVVTKATGDKRTTSTVAWLPSDFRTPGSSAPEILTAAIQDLAKAIELAVTHPAGLDPKAILPLQSIAPTLSHLLQQLRETFVPADAQPTIAGAQPAGSKAVRAEAERRVIRAPEAAVRPLRVATEAATRHFDPPGLAAPQHTQPRQEEIRPATTPAFTGDRTPGAPPPAPRHSSEGGHSGISNNRFAALDDIILWGP